jgi:hypothetical protein
MARTLLMPRCVAAIALLACALAGPARAVCVLRVAYVDQDRPPYYLGTGATEARPPGASVDLLHEIARAAGCTMRTVRLPLLRIRPALRAGSIDAAPLDIEGHDLQDFAYPLDAAGQADGARGLAIYNVLFVRRADRVASDVDPAPWLRGRVLGVPHGASYAPALRSAGIAVDDGAVDSVRKFDKLLLGRRAAFTVALTAPGDLDGLLAAHYQDRIVRLARPLRTSHVWLAFGRRYRNAHPEAVDTMWRWIGVHGARRFRALLRNYPAQP